MIKNQKTSVWWDIDSCPVPVGYDASRVGPCIRLALEKLGCFGPITMSVIGNLKNTPDHILGALSSSGMVVKHVKSGRRKVSFYSDKWSYDNPPPANIMLITDSLCIECVSRTLSGIQERGFNILLAYEGTRDPNKQGSNMVTCAEWSWKTLLQGVSPHNRRQPFQLETGESACFVCTICRDDISNEVFSCQSLEDFTTHLWGKEHQLKEFIIQTRNQKDRNFVELLDVVESSHPTTMVKKRSKRNTLKNKVVNAEVGSSRRNNAITKQSKVELNQIKKKSNKRRKKFLRRMTE